MDSSSDGPDMGVPPGWYPVDPHTERWWTGTAWAAETRPMFAPARPPANAPVHAAPAASYGSYPPPPRRAVTYTPRETNHVLHLILTILTCGVWGIVWLAMVIVNAISKKKSVTHYR